MALESDIEVLSRAEFFSGFSHEQLRLIAFGSQRRHLAAGRELFYQGQKTESGFLVLSGKIDLLVDFQGSLNEVESFSTGSVIGEMALLVENRRVGTAVASEDSQLLEIPRSIVLRVVEEYPELALQLQGRISKSVGEFVENLESLRQQLAD